MAHHHHSEAVVKVGVRVTVQVPNPGSLAARDVDGVWGLILQRRRDSCRKNLQRPLEEPCGPFYLGPQCLLHPVGEVSNPLESTLT